MSASDLKLWDTSILLFELEILRLDRQERYASKTKGRRRDAVQLKPC